MTEHRRPVPPSRSGLGFLAAVIVLAAFGFTAMDSRWRLITVGVVLLTLMWFNRPWRAA